MIMLRKILVALSLIAIGVVMPFICDGDITVSVVSIPLGLYAMFGKDTVY